MMVNQYDDARLFLVLQIDHSRVAGLLAAHWGNERFAELRPYGSMVLAAQEHDNGWWEWEIKPTLNAEGYPLDYINSGKYLRRVWTDFHSHGIDRLAEQDPYAGLMVLIHQVGLLKQGYGLLPYMPSYEQDAEAQPFLQDREVARLRLLQQLRGSEQFREAATDEGVWTNFKYMEVFDQLAQFICNRYPFNSTVRRNGPSKTLSNTPVPVRPGEQDASMRMDVLDESRAVVRPYPFGVDPLVVSYQGRFVPNRRYEDQEDFLRAFYRAERVTVTYSLMSEANAV